MKLFKYLLIGIMPLLVSGCDNETKILLSDVEDAGLKGRVKMYCDSVFGAKEMFGEIIKGSLKTVSVKKFNKSGDIIFFAWNDYYYEYDIEYDGDTKIIHQKLDNNGSVNKEIITKIITNNKKEQKLRIDELDENGKLLDRKDLMYDSKCRITNYTIYGSDGQKEEVWSANFNIDGSCTIERWSFNYDTYSLKRLDSDMNLKEELRYGYDSEKDEKGDLISKLLFSDNSAELSRYALLTPHKALQCDHNKDASPL